jgi:hypothetical protein
MRAGLKAVVADTRGPFLPLARYGVRLLGAEGLTRACHPVR